MQDAYQDNQDRAYVKVLGLWVKDRDAYQCLFVFPPEMRRGHIHSIKALAFEREEAEELVANFVALADIANSALGLATPPVVWLDSSGRVIS